MICVGAERAVFLQGLPEMAIREVELSQAFIRANKGIVGLDIQDVKFDHIDIRVESGPVFNLQNSSNVEIVLEETMNDYHTLLRLSGSGTQGILLKSLGPPPNPDQVECGPGVPPGAYILH